MRTLMLAVLVLSACATVPVSKYEEDASCPAAMTNEQAESGVVRCRAMCSSYGRDMAGFRVTDCKCFCRPASGQKPAADVNRNAI